MVTELKGRNIGDFSKNIEFSKQKDQGWCSMMKKRDAKHLLCIVPLKSIFLRVLCALPDLQDPRLRFVLTQAGILQVFHYVDVLGKK